MFQIFRLSRMLRQRPRQDRIGRLQFGLTVFGCCALSVLPLRAYHHYSDPRSSSGLVDLLPRDLDAIGSNPVFWNAVGIQLLLFGGYKKTGGEWERYRTNAKDVSLQDRLEWITPTFKAGGVIDYSFQGSTGIFGDDLSLFKQGSIEDMASLAETLEGMGLSVQDFDVQAQTAIQTMLSWNSLKCSVSAPPLDSALLIFSFDATPHCYSVQDCPLPGPSNELLAATALQFIEDNPQQNIPIIAQWEVAAALQKEGFSKVLAVGTPGKFQNTAEIFDLMLCQWSALVRDDRQPQDAILMAHPDHLRRVLWTAETILKRNDPQKCALSKPRLMTAMHPYRLDWPSQTTPNLELNLYDSVATTVHTQGEQIWTSWYDYNVGFFPDGDPQKWTHQREVWLLYDQWAIVKGIVTGTIDTNVLAQK